MEPHRQTELRFLASRSAGEVSALWLRPADARAALVLSHGAGAGMRHAFLESVARGLAERGVATLRYQFPYTEQGSRRPDPPAVLVATVRAAVACAAEHAGELPLFAGGKSLGGRMTTTAAARGPLPGVRGLVLLGFPLHASGQPDSARGEHLHDVTQPMLFLQGTRDPLADLPRMRALCEALSDRARLHVVEGGDHSFHVLKRSGRKDEEALAEIAEVIAGWTGARTAA